MKTFYVTRERDSAGDDVGRRRPAPRGVRRRVLIAIALAAGLAAACGGSPTRPTPPTPAAPTLSCQADVALQSLDGQPVAYTVTPPAAQGGAPPVAVACNAPGAFPVGTTPVICTATDRLQRQGTCNFRVEVAGPPTLPVTRFLAFGDSLTAGVVSPAPTFLLLSPADSYPTQLQRLFIQRYTTQTILVENSGVPGELAGDTGLTRLSSEIFRWSPEVVLLMEGTNDLNGRTPDRVAQVLDDMTRDAFQRGKVVFLATLPPARPILRPTQAARIPVLNELIKGIAARYQPNGVHLVDVYAPLAADMSLIGQDDLHPTAEGYKVMARTWLDAIVAALEPRPSTALSPRRR